MQEYYAYEGQDRVAVVGPNGVDVFGSGVAGPILESYLFDGIDHPLRIKQGATTAYYELDLAGNVRGLRASGGASLGGYRYSAFGQTLEDTTSINQPLRWKGRWFSPVAGGTYDVRARQWSPELGVFLSIDEFRYMSSRGTLWGWPGMNPIRFRDPSGHKQQESMQCDLEPPPKTPDERCYDRCERGYRDAKKLCPPEVPPIETYAPHGQSICSYMAEVKMGECKGRCMGRPEPTPTPIPNADPDDPEEGPHFPPSTQASN